MAGPEGIEPSTFPKPWMSQRLYGCPCMRRIGA